MTAALLHLLLAFHLLIPQNAIFFGQNQMASNGGFAPVYQTSGNCSSGGFSCTVTLSVTAGQFAVCGVGSTSVPTNTLTCSDTNSDTFSYPTGNPYLFTGNSIGSFGLATMSTTNATEVFTCTVTNNTNSMGCVVALYSGTPTSGWDVVVAGANNSTTLSFTTGTSSVTANASELGVALFTQDSSTSNVWTGGSGWTVEQTLIGGASVIYADKVLSVTGAQTATATLVGANVSGLGMVSTIK